MKSIFFSLFIGLFSVSSAQARSVVVVDPNPVGNWQKPCQDIDGDIISSSIKVEKKTKLLWSESEIAYESENCKVPYIKFQKKYEAVIGANNLDLTFIDVTYTPLANEVAEALNEAEFCGIKAWKLNKEQSILNKICADVGNYVTGQKLYSILKITTAGLFVGFPSEAFDGSSPAKRHLQFESNPYLKASR